MNLDLKIFPKSIKICIDKRTLEFLKDVFYDNFPKKITYIDEVCIDPSNCAHADLIFYRDLEDFKFLKYIAKNIIISKYERDCDYDSENEN